ncbi:MAG: Uncharacterised protein [Methanobacteriota archaeon]|nr:MAG: Uncharacterised protein [Euryarchaeota archaeon]|tara:strand:- start:237 stop:497 length:261 start_codon:yes stop_codon:yes gene_type:complete
MDVVDLIGWLLVLILFIVLIMGLFWIRGRSLRLEEMLSQGDVEILNVENTQSEVLNHLPVGSRIIPYTPYIAEEEGVNSAIHEESM